MADRFLVLAIDTAADTCAAVVWDAAACAERGRAVWPMRTGHAEHLIAVIDAALREAGVAFADLGRIAVSVGPGSFTGVRVGVAAARGFALALAIPAIGISTLEAVAAETRLAVGPQPVLAVLGGGDGRFQAAAFDGQGGVLRPPAALDLATVKGWATEQPFVLAGSGASLLAAALPDRFLKLGATVRTADIAVFARLGAAKRPGEAPRPLYLRPPDAKPQGGAILSGAAG